MLCKIGLLLAGFVTSVSCDDCSAKLSGRLYDKDRACLQGWQPVGCNPNQGSCPAATTYAVDAAGRCFFFRDLCVPTGFTRATDSDTRCPSPGAQVDDCS